jgi:hypothetical protein
MVDAPAILFASEVGGRAKRDRRKLVGPRDPHPHALDLEDVGQILARVLREALEAQALAVSDLGDRPFGRLVDLGPSASGWPQRVGEGRLVAMREQPLSPVRRRPSRTHPAPRDTARQQDHALPRPCGTRPSSAAGHREGDGCGARSVSVPGRRSRCSMSSRWPQHVASAALPRAPNARGRVSRSFAGRGVPPGLEIGRAMIGPPGGGRSGARGAVPLSWDPATARCRP